MKNPIFDDAFKQTIPAIGNEARELPDNGVIMPYLGPGRRYRQALRVLRLARGAQRRRPQA